MRPSTRNLFQWIWALPTMFVLLMSSQAIANGNSLKYEVAITNITQGQILSPAVVASHKSGLEPIFQLGQPASAELAAVAEDADLAGLIADLEMNPHIIEVGTLAGAATVIMPGETASIVLDAGHGFGKGQISLVGMLVTTNDGFYGLNSATAVLPSGFRHPGQEETYFVPAYDAGSEANSELCMYIPGPPCGSPFAHDPAPAEGFVHIHPGIHGVGDLVPAVNDWRNPVAKITVRLISAE